MLAQLGMTWALYMSGSLAPVHFVCYYRVVLIMLARKWEWVKGRQVYVADGRVFAGLHASVRACSCHQQT